MARTHILNKRKGRGYPPLFGERVNSSSVSDLICNRLLSSSSSSSFFFARRSSFQKKRIKKKKRVRVTYDDDIAMATRRLWESVTGARCYLLLQQRHAKVNKTTRTAYIFLLFERRFLNIALQQKRRSHPFFAHAERKRIFNTNEAHIDRSIAYRRGSNHDSSR